jgi:hypothetical protein
VLVAVGDVERGMRLLREAFAENVDPGSKALNALFLALGSARGGNLHEANELLRKAEKLDPGCSQLTRIGREVERQAGQTASTAVDKST